MRAKRAKDQPPYVVLLACTFTGLLLQIVASAVLIFQGIDSPPSGVMLIITLVVVGLGVYLDIGRARRRLARNFERERQELRAQCRAESQRELRDWTSSEEA